MVVSAGVVWALYIVYSRKIVVSGNPGIDVGSVNLSWAIIILTTIIFSPAAAVYVLFEPTQLLGLLSFEAVFAIIYLGVVCTTIAFTLYFKGLKYVSATSTALILLSEIVFAIVLSSILLVEPVTVYIIIGGLLISSAIILLRKS
ncbi:MAG: DMT family transporter [Candidatus Odinarchaeota archaeon]